MQGNYACPLHRCLPVYSAHWGQTTACIKWTISNSIVNPFKNGHSYFWFFSIKPNRKGIVLSSEIAKFHAVGEYICHWGSMPAPW